MVPVFLKTATRIGRLSRTGPHRHGRRNRAERGAIAVMTACVIILMMAMFGFALDLSRAYNRKMELQSVAEVVALAAARALDGTSGGIDNAMKEAADTAANLSFSYNYGDVAWSPEALKFGTASTGGTAGWLDGAAAKAQSQKVYFARVDTSALDAGHGRIVNLLVPVLSPSFAQTNVAATAVAGRDALNALPLAICANENTQAKSLPSTGELVEYGFRRGVSYNLMNLNPGASTPENFLVNPIAPAGSSGTVKDKLDIVALHVCTGKMAIPVLQSGEVTVERGFPIDALHPYLNARFSTVSSPCPSASITADPNSTSFDLANVTWMKDKPDGVSASEVKDTGFLLTVAEKPDTATKTAYGPLWSYAKAAKYSSYVSYKDKGGEPTAGYTTFTTSDWDKLYKPGLPAAQNYPSSTPYQTTGGTSAYKTSSNTRVLRIPLLECPMTAGAKVTAKVLGIGKFFMTVPATSSAVHAEFAGLENWAATNDVRLY